MPQALNILSGGAAHGLVESLAAKFKALTGLDIEGEFGPVGGLADKLRQGTPADIVIFTAEIAAKLADEKRVVAGSVSDVGMVETALAVRSGDPLIKVSDGATLRAALLASDAIFVPDTRTSTAGIHVGKILHKLGIADDVADRLHILSSGATAMGHLATSEAERPIGCTQSTEIISTPGVVLSGSLPHGYDLATTYTAAVTSGAAHAREARALIDLLIGPDQQALRTAAGFVNKAR